MTISFSTTISSDQVAFDLLIIGSGPAGLAIATEFLGTGISVAVLESGGLERDAESDTLNAFETAGQPRAPHDAVGCRGLGGSTALWTGRCGPLDAIDYHARPWLPLSGWPIGPADLSPHYQRAANFLNLAGTGTGDLGLKELRRPFDEPAHDDAVFKPALWQFSTSMEGTRRPVRHFTPEGRSPMAILQHTGAPEPVHAGRRAQAALESSKNVHVLTQMTVLDIRVDDSGGAVSGVRARTQDERIVEMNAPKVVLACGGIQNPRLLLASNSQKANGLGNDHDQVGRYLTDHMFTEIATYRRSGEAQEVLRRMGNRWHPHRSTRRVYSVGLRLSEEFQREHELVNAAMHIVEFGSKMNVLSTLARGARRLKKGALAPALKDLADAAKRPGELIAAINDRYRMRMPPLNAPDRAVIGCVVEQELNPDSRVSLGAGQDRFGQRIARIDWRISDREYRTVRAVEQAYCTEATRLGFARHDRPNWAKDDSESGFETWKRDLIDLAHPSCTTRMSDDPQTGVVDAHGKVHGVDGLYVAGSSVFASNSHMNPTMSIVALSLRLADHLRSEIRRSVAAKAKSVGDHRIRVGFVGGGRRVASVYVPVMAALAAEIVVCGVVTRSAVGSARIAHQTGWASGTDLDAFLAREEPDLLIAAPSRDAVDATYPALIDRRVPILLETPFCVNDQSGRVLLKQIQRRGLSVGVAEQFPFLPEMQLLQQVIGLGLIGQVTSVLDEFAHPARAGVAAMRSLMGRNRSARYVEAVRIATAQDTAGLAGTVFYADGRRLVHKSALAADEKTAPDKGFFQIIGTRGIALPWEIRFGHSATDMVTVAPIRREEIDGDLKAIAVTTPDGEMRWTNPFFGHRLNDEQIAVACLVRGMAEAVRSNAAPPYPAWTALEDVELFNALIYSADHDGGTVGLPANRLRPRMRGRASRSQNAEVAPEQPVGQ